MVVMISPPTGKRASAKEDRITYLIPSLMVDNPRDNKTIRLVVIVVLALIVAYLLYSAS